MEVPGKTGLEVNKIRLIEDYRFGSLTEQLILSSISLATSSCSILCTTTNWVLVDCLSRRQKYYFLAWEYCSLSYLRYCNSLASFLQEDLQE